jgi:hypothetical protein
LASSATIIILIVRAGSKRLERCFIMVKPREQLPGVHECRAHGTPS